MSVEKFRELVRQEVEAALGRYFDDNKDVDKIKSAVTKDMTEYITRTSKVKESITNDPAFTKYQIVTAGQELPPIIVINSEGLKQRFTMLEDRIKKRLDYIEKLVKP